MAGSNTNNDDQLHVVMLPFLAFGHMIPFIQFSIALAKAGVKVTFISTPRNIQRLPKIPQNLSPLINLVRVPLPNLENEAHLPENAEATIDITFDKIQYLKIAFDLLKQPFKEFVADQSPDYIISDFTAYWTAEIGGACGIPVIAFSAFTAATNVFFGPPKYLTGDRLKSVRPSPESLTSPPDWVNFPSSVAYRQYEARYVLPGFFGENASGVPDSHRVAKMLDACEVLVVRSCNEFESEYLNLMEKLIEKPVIPIGLLPPEMSKKSEINDGSWEKVFKWLDQQNPKSVIFVGFGSECKLLKDQVHEIAHGLELSKLPFLWALRKPNWAVDDLDALPLGFGDRTSGDGMVCFGWAPQLEILGHPSIGGSLFHAGWGSVIETLQFGHVLVVLPFIIDQTLNARLLIDKGLAVEVERSDENGSFTRDGIAMSLRLAMVSMEGEKYRVRAREAAVVFGDHKLHQDHYIARFVEYLKNGARKQN